jgi:UDP-glucose:(heptosyl)LPS alpha-1,3-glucosyltransferase
LEKLLYSLSLISRRDFDLLVIGKDKKMAYFQALTKKLKLDKNIRFFGERSDVMRFYQLADALVIPSFYDPFANVTLEALAMGLYVVSSRTNGGHEILTQENGVVIETLDSLEAIGAALEHAMQHPKNRKSSEKIRLSVKHLDFSNQLAQFTNLCLQ